jgi:hypothetical protein
MPMAIIEWNHVNEPIHVLLDPLYHHRHLSLVQALEFWHQDQPIAPLIARRVMR